ncbi:hypothetical protein TPHA_0C02930 [Tetrapisispora phaffii CBS 4417]|uniref:XPG N-terminal domain-containing protein n=1 Tax=Tetrapisispora phaffii (strain ATCC 24235 / CBS 4417 / NBRC 1672 / NRRL Y-8282 / UCD 70-5) TaxID=1071381 RepID=G8BRS0_TETPH|nr:hypothetical protein TPHA_0C02930 [Tetrapisispora phaffii CBS 4417]CCE62446.1 hypothetical protein TPHA_0C02930 [Tetrapisispora phaffii CBS 4417]
MPIKTLESYLFERGLVGSYPIDILKNATIGIDVNHYLSRIINNKKNNQLTDAIGEFLPNNLNHFLENDLKIFEENKITPIFVFNGLLTVNQAEYHHSNARFNEGAVNNLEDINTNIFFNKFKISNHRDKAWRSYEYSVKKNQETYIDQPVVPHLSENFNYANNINFSTNLKNYLIRFFIERKISYQVAPYSSWLQLSYLYDSEFIDIIYGPTDCLMLPNMEKFIIGMEFLNKEFRFIDKTKILKDLDLTNDEFVDIAMVLGNDLQPLTLPPLNTINLPTNKMPNSSNNGSNINTNAIVDMAIDMVYNTGTNFYVYQLNNLLQDNNKKNLQFYQRGYSSLKNMPVLQANGKVQLYSSESVLNARDLDKKKNKSTETGSKQITADKQLTTQYEIPNDVYDFIGQQLPAEYYFYQSIGLLDTKLLETLTSGFYYEDIPFSGVPTKSYKQLIKKSAEVFKDLEIGLLTSPINRYYQIKTIKAIIYNNVSGENPDEIQLTNKVTPPTFDKINKIVVKTKTNQQFTIKSFVKLLSNSKDLTKDFTSEIVLFPNTVSSEDKLNVAFDLLATNLLRTLCLLGIFEYDVKAKSLEPTKWGKLLLNFPHLNITETNYSALLVLMIFIKLNVLPFTDSLETTAVSTLSNATLRSYPVESSYIDILSRLLTLYQIGLENSSNDSSNNSNYHGPIDRSSLIVKDHFDYINNNLKELFQSVLVASLASGEFNRLSLKGNTAWQSEIIARLPFNEENTNTIMSMMWEYFLQKYLHNGNTKTDALAFVSTEFKTLKITTEIDEKFNDSLKFLKEVLVLSKELNESNLMNSKEYEIIGKSLEFAEKALSS